MNDQAQQQLAAIHERHEKATADAIETFKQRHPHWNIPTEDEIASCYEAYFGDGEVKFLLTLLADAEWERGHYNEEAKHAWGNVKIFQDELTKVQQLLAAANERAEQAAAARQAEIVAWSNVAPTKSGLYWHWNGDDDCCPIPLHVGWSGPNGPCFVMRGQYCIETAIDCDEYGGWWAPLPNPSLPDADAIEAGEAKGGGDG